MYNSGVWLTRFVIFAGCGPFSQIRSHIDKGLILAQTTVGHKVWFFSVKVNVVFLALVLRVLLRSKKNERAQEKEDVLELARLAHNYDCIRFPCACKLIISKCHTSRLPIILLG